MSPNLASPQHQKATRRNCKDNENKNPDAYKIISFEFSSHLVPKKRKKKENRRAKEEKGEHFKIERQKPKFLALAAKSTSKKSRYQRTRQAATAGGQTK